MHWGHSFPGKGCECWLQRSAAHRLTTVWDTGFLSKVDIPNKTNHAWLFNNTCRPTAAGECGRSSATALSACSKSRDVGGEEASPAVTLRLHHRSRKNQSHKQRRTPKVALKPQSRWMRAPTPAAAGPLMVVSAGQPEMWQRGAKKKKTLSPNVPLSPST